MNVSASRAILSSIVAAAMALTPQCASAWGPVGHRAVGGVADRLLNAKAREQVAMLLAHDLDKNDQPSGRTTLEAVSTWADEIRRTPADRPNRHFDDIPTCGEVPATPTWCPASGECATNQIEVLSAVLADATKPERDRNEALKWIVHLVGDLHQPLHAASNIYEQNVVDAKGNHTDRGGNDVQVAIAGTKTRGQRELHGVWDNDLVNLAFGRAVTNRGGLPSATLDALAATALKLPSSAKSGPPIEWARESNGLARSTAYDFEEFVCAEPVDSIVVLDRAYVARTKRLIPEQIERAGARLAKLLNDLLSSGQ